MRDGSKGVLVVAFAIQHGTVFQNLASVSRRIGLSAEIRSAQLSVLAPAWFCDRDRAFNRKSRISLYCEGVERLPLPGCSGSSGYWSQIS